MREVDITFGDVRDIDAMREIITGADVIFHLSALVGIPYSYEHPQEVIDTNILGTANVLLVAKELGTLERVVLTSTSEVYGSALYTPIDELHPLQAQSPGGRRLAGWAAQGLRARTRRRARVRPLPARPGSERQCRARADELVQVAVTGWRAAAGPIACAGS